MEVSKSDRLPIKLIMPKQGRERKVPTGGSKPKPFRRVNLEYRNRLSNQVAAISKTIPTISKQYSVVPVRVRLLTKALAKSHRPENLFSQETCPIVGAGKLGELFIKGTEKGLDNLTHKIKTGRSHRIIKELSCVNSIEPITPNYRCNGKKPLDILRNSPRKRDGFITRVRLFNFGNTTDQEVLTASFEETCRNNNIRIIKRGYSQNSYIFGVECHSVNDIEILSKEIGVRTIASMPLLRTIRPSMYDPKPLPKLPTREDVSGDIPVVAVVDSGISNNIPELESWVVDRESEVAPEYRNTDHGTFVAGLICWGSNLNPTIRSIDPNPCAVFDFQIIPNYDPSKGDTDSLLEQEFLVSLETALRKHTNKYKVWNLSLGTDSVCSLDDFSEFAEELDNLQEKYQVSFVISAGNYEIPPLLDYPRKDSQIEIGRITTPADSVLGISVGSVSHVDYNQMGPKMHHPAAFSRHGAGPNHIIKPDLVHYGGACSIDGNHISGVRSIHQLGTAENIGTSFATPLVSKTLAQIYHHITPSPNPTLARAILTHHARDPRNQERVPDGEENFFGFGLPSPIPYCLECSPNTSTLIFDDVLHPGYYLEWDDFPYPRSLMKNGKYYGEIWMTVAFSPSRGPRWGSEYCETHISAHFGVYRDRVNRTTGEVKSQFRGLVPPEHKNPGLLYESFQIEKLRKWAPVRTYYGNLGKNGERGNRWRLKVQLLTRHGIEDKTTFRPQPFSLIVTIADPKNSAPVYDEMAQIVRNRFQAQNLTLRASAQIRARS